jgi:D-glycero-alpha-D-manno-heptose 1-phosphate guanylyltransferase
MINECIILAGGLGTRLRPVVSELPKCMATVAGKPFLHYIISHLQKQGIEKFILSIGYKSESVIEYLDAETVNYKLQSSNFNVGYSIEKEPLGTGGAIKLSLEKATEKNVLVLNGDTLFSIDIGKLSAFHQMCGADCTLGLKPMKNFERYGVVELNKDYSIKNFKEKQFYESGLINGGIYALNAGKFLKEALPEKFSFEKDYLEKYFDKRRMYGVIQDRYFIDIGIPEDYERVQTEFKNLQI